MPTTTNYGWTTPADTDLVKDGASAIRTLGNGVDTTVKALNPETTLGDIAYRSSTANTNTRLAIGTEGQVLKVTSGVPAWGSASSGYVGCAVYTTTNQTISADTYTAVNWNSEQFDTDGFHDNTTNNSRFTVPSGKAGKYLITWTFTDETDGGTNNTVAKWKIYKNGSAMTGYAMFYHSPNKYIGNTGSVVVNAAVSDYFQIFYTRNVDTATISANNSSASFTFLGA